MSPSIDIATRLIHNEICLTLALLGIASQFAGPTHIIESLVAATILFLLLLVVYQRGWMGGGDVKLLVALAIGLPLTGVVQLLTVTALAGGVLAAGASDDASPAVSPAGARRIVAPAPRLRGRALAQFAARAAALRGRHRVRRYLDCSQPRSLTCRLLCVSRSSWCCCWQRLRSGLIAYNTYQPKPVAQVAQNAPAPVTIGYFVAAHPLPAGTLARDEDFEVRVRAVRHVPSGAILDTPDAKAGLRGSLVRRFLDTGAPITSEDVLRPRDRGFLASVLAPDTRAISIKVDAESGVSGLIWPGDLCGCRVDPGERQGGPRASRR